MLSSQERLKTTSRRGGKEKVCWLTFLVSLVLSDFFSALSLEAAASKYYLLIKLKVMALKNAPHYVICKHILEKCYNC